MPARRLRTLAVLLMVALVVPAAVAHGASSVGSLSLGRALYWDGAYVADATAEPFSESYRFEVEEKAYALRVAIDVPMRDDEYELSVEGPRDSASAVNGNSYNAEVLIPSPASGTYTITVTSNDATDSAFRLRAYLQKRAERFPGDGPLLPNLQVIPPFEFGFVAPANPLNGSWPPDDLNPPLAAGPVHPVSCAADEIAEDGATKCLRFSAGPTNAGDGPFRILLEGSTSSSAAQVEAKGKAFQEVLYADGSRKQRRAGTWEYHKTHAHNHYTDVLTYRLFEVVGKRMEAAGKGVKSGFCPADQAFADWTSFAQDAQHTSGGDCNSSMGLSRGWGDVYRWQRPGQYVEFGDNADGLYVVTATADARGWVLETNERDNSGYALVEITGDQVEVLERGRGAGPFDPARVVIPDWWRGPAYRRP